MGASRILRILPENWVNIIYAYALAPCIARASAATMLSTEENKYLIIFHEQILQPPEPQFWDLMGNTNTFMCFLTQNHHQEGKEIIFHMFRIAKGILTRNILWLKPKQQWFRINKIHSNLGCGFPFRCFRMNINILKFVLKTGANQHMQLSKMKTLAPEAGISGRD